MIANGKSVRELRRLQQEMRRLRPSHSAGTLTSRTTRGTTRVTQPGSKKVASATDDLTWL